MCEDADVRTALFAIASSGCLTALTVTTPSTVVDGAIAPGFVLPAQDGTSISLASALERGPVVLVFYRGYW